MNLSDDYWKQMQRLDKLVNPAAFEAIQKASKLIQTPAIAGFINQQKLFGSMFPLGQTMNPIKYLGINNFDFSLISSFQSQLSKITTALKPTNALLTAIESNDVFSHAFNQSGIFDAIAKISRNMPAIEAIHKLNAILPTIKQFDCDLSFADDGNIIVDGETVSKDDIFDIAKEFEKSSLDSLALPENTVKIKSKKGKIFLIVLLFIVKGLFVDPIKDKVFDEIRKQIGINKIIEKIDVKKWVQEIFNMSIIETLSTIIQAISLNTEIETIYLFGSFAYGNPKQDSDLDIYLVIPDSDVDICDLNAEIRFALYKKLSYPLDLVIAKKSVFERRSKAPTLENTIAKQGVRIYGN
jgi:predicted nucleotidyltransferase